MARVTVEDCIDKVENRFDLVLLASHRARMISSGAQITSIGTTTRTRSWRCAKSPRTAISPGDLKEELVHSLQKYVEVDEPEPETVPLIGAPGTGVDADDTEVTTDRMTEEELLKGLEGLTPPEEQPEAARVGRRRGITAASRRSSAGPSATGLLNAKAALRRLRSSASAAISVGALPAWRSALWRDAAAP